MKKIVFITGTSKGIGCQMAGKLLESGYEIVGFDRQPGEHAWASMSCDLSKISDLSEAFDAAVDRFGVPYALINNAGVYQAKSWDQQSAEDFDLTLAVNSKAPFLLSKLFAQYAIKAKSSGVIVNISSVSATLGSIDVAYAASKAALNMVTKSLAKSLAAHNIRVVSVSPGPVETDMAARIPEERQKSYKEAIPLKRFAQPSEISNVVCFLLSEEASYLTGTEIRVDGGLA